MEDLFNVFHKFEDVPVNHKNGVIRETMFPDDEETMKNVYKIHHTLRLMPHDQNTGGFYLALIKKKSHIVFGGGSKKQQQKAAKKQMTDEAEEKKQSVP